MRLHRLDISLLVLIILFGFALRIYQLDRQPLRGDESFTIQYWMMVPLAETIDQQLTVDPQPFLAYALFNLWGKVVGMGAFTARMLPALGGVLGVPAMYVLARRVTRLRSASLLAAFMWALHPFIIWHSQDVRNYALWSSVSLISVWLGLCAVERGRRADWLLYITLTTVAGYLYYLDLFVVASLAAYVLVVYFGRWRVYRRWFLSLCAIGLLLAPWYLQPALLSGGGYGGTTTGFDFSRLLTVFPVILTFGDTLPLSFAGVGWVSVLSLLIGSILVAFRHRWETGWFVLLMCFGPLILLSMVTLRLNVLAPRYVLGISGVLVIAFSLFVVWFARVGRFPRVVGVFVYGSWLLMCLLSLQSYYNDYMKAPNWDALTAYLADNVTDDALVIQAAADASFGYYYHHVHNIPADERALPAQPEQPAHEIERELVSARQTYDAIWIVAQGFTDWPNYGVTEQWLDANMQRVVDTRTDGLRIQQYRRWEPDRVMDDTTALAQFGAVVRLQDVHLLAEPQPTGELVVWAYWQPLTRTDVPLKAFLHLTSANPNPLTGSPLWAQEDHEPQHGRATTTEWEPGTIYRDVFSLPDVAALPPGTYTLEMGLYDPTTGTRLLTIDGADRHTIGTYVVEAKERP